jgi:hypothetical protein
VSPILTRPVREQLEHDRVIRQLQARYKRKNDVVINPGNEQNQSITVGDLVVFPDVVLLEQGGRRLMGTVEVETGESVNSIEARAEWGVYSKIRVPLHLYLPPSSVDAAKRLCAEYHIVVSEIWTYTTTFDQVRFTQVFKGPEVPMARITLPKPPPPVVKLAPPPPPPPEPVKIESVVKAKAGAKPVVAAKAAAVKTAPVKPVVAAKPTAKPAVKPKPVVKAKPVAKAKPAPKAKPKAKVTKPAAKKPLTKAKAKPAAKKGAKKR